MEAWRLLTAVAATQLPLGLAPVVGGGRSHHFGQIHAGQTREGIRGSQRLGLVDAAGHDAAGLGALFAQDAGQAAGVEIGDRHDVLARQVIR